MANSLTYSPETILYASYVYDERIHRGIAKYAQSRGWLIKSILPHNWQLTGSRNYVGIISSLEAEGDSTGMNDYLCSLGLPMVDMSLNMPELKVPRFLLDLRKSGELAAAHLLEKGYTGLTYIGWGDTWHDDLRARGFAAVAKAKGVKEDYLWLRSGGKTVQQAIFDYLKALPEKTGVYCSYDRVAATALYEAKLAGRNVPNSLGIIGSQNHEADSAYTEIPISTVDLNLQQQGYSAAEALDTLIAGKDLPCKHYIIPGAKVIERASTQPGLGSAGFAMEVSQFISENLDRDISVPDLCELTSTSSATLQRKFKESFGHGVATEVRLQRIEKAKHLLQTTGLTATAISEQLGYSDVSQFFRSFKRIVGLTAQEYRSQSTSASQTPWK